MHQKPNIDLLVVSCDSFFDVWRPFFKSFHYNWKDCGLKIFLLSNEKECKEHMEFFNTMPKPGTMTSRCINSNDEGWWNKKDTI